LTEKNSKEETYSYSRITSFSKCPRAYKYRYVDKIREAFTSVEAHMGRAVHEALAWLYEARESEGTADCSTLLAKFDDEWRAGLGTRTRLIRQGDSFEARQELGRAMLKEHHAGPFSDDRLTTVATEQNLSTRLNGHYRYRGIIDRLGRDAEGALHLIDYKTTGRPPERLDDEGSLQLRSYGMLALEEHGGATARLTYQFLKNRSELSETFRAGDTEDLARDLASRISRAEAASDFPAQPSALCAWCGYREMCDVSGFYEGSGSSASSADPAVCPRCDGRLRLRKGQFGAFLGCANYPRCRYTKNA
jgi:putative RecB family exonuclease